MLVSCSANKTDIKNYDVPKLAFTHACVIPITKDTLLQDYTVLVDHGIISAMGPSSQLRIPLDFQQIDAQGKYVMPGLTDMHVHLSDDADMLKFVQHGVTTIRNMSDIPWWTRMMGFSNILKLRQKQQQRKIIGPDIYTCGYTLDGNPPVSPMNKRITSEDDARKEIIAEKQKGYDAIKLYDNLSFPAYKAIVSEAAKVGLPVAGHVPHAVPLKVILHDKILSIEHLTGYIDNKTADYIIPKDELNNYIHLNRESGIYNTPTLSVWACMPPENGIDSLKNTSKFKALSWHLRWMWKTALPYYYEITYPDKAGYTKQMLHISSDLTYRLYKAGCPLLIGTDTNIAGTYVGETTWLEMELFVRAGIPVYETLRSATILPAHALGKEKETGTIEAGKKANLIILDKNPLENISNIRSLHWVYCNGFLVPGAN
jgi:imidazolonepropionase-like amidohydrolase